MIMLALIAALGLMADGPKPDRHGILTLAAEQAELVGEALKLGGDADRRYVEGWTTTDELVRWSFDASRAGRYLVVVEYAATAGKGGAEFEVEVADQVRAATVQATGAADRFLPQPLKEGVDLPAGRQCLEVRATSAPKAFVMNLARVRLVPAEEEDAR